MHKRSEPALLEQSSDLVWLTIILILPLDAITYLNSRDLVRRLVVLMMDL